MARKRLWFFLSLALLLHLVYQLFTQQGPVDAVSCEGQECSPYSPADSKGNANATGVYANGLATTHVALEALSSYDPEPRHDFTNKLTENNYIDKNTIKLSEKSAKKIVFYTKFFGDDTWVKMLGNGTDLREHQCPVSNCVFSYNISEAPEADAVLFHATDYNPFNVPKTRHSHQRYVWVTVESPGVQGGEDRDAHNLPFFNWTATYHRGSEIFVPYGYLVPLEGSPGSRRPGILNRSDETYRAYLAELSSNSRPGKAVREWFFDRPKVVSWMVSHCTTASGREIYVRQLQQFIDVDVYGARGNLSCGISHLDTYCYTQHLNKYKFYLAFENSMCEDYITEKLWYPLLFGLIPVVFGGAHYEDFLPPNSYVDATKLTPPQVAALLKRVAASPKEYQKYHVWRRYWKVVIPPPLCELCARLHEETPPSVAPNPLSWWPQVNGCYTRYPLSLYPRIDMRLVGGFLLGKFHNGLHFFKSIMGNAKST